MAEHIHLDAPEDVPAHHNHKPVPIRIDDGNEHDVFDVAKHLQSTTGEKGASVTQPLHHFANKQHDVEAHFSRPEHQKNLRSHLDADVDSDTPDPSHALQSAMREVHHNVPKNVEKTGKSGAAKEAMLRAIAYSKSEEK